MSRLHYIKPELQLLAMGKVLAVKRTVQPLPNKRIEPIGRRAMLFIRAERANSSCTPPSAYAGRFAAQVAAPGGRSLEIAAFSRPAVILTV